MLQLAFGLGVPVAAVRISSGPRWRARFLVAPSDVTGLNGAIVRYFYDDQSAAFRTAIDIADHRMEYWI